MKLIICFLLIQQVITNNEDEFKYEYKIERVTDIATTKQDIPNFGKHPFTKFSPDTLKLACLGARNVASLDGNPYSIAENSFPWKYSIQYTDNRTENQILIPCKTIPKLFLGLGKSNTEIIILLKENVFETDYYKYELDEITSIREISNDCFIDAENTGSFLSKLDPEERLNMCIGAKKQIPNEPIMQDSQVEKPKWFLVKYPRILKRKITTLKRIVELEAIECPSRPYMYLHYEESERIIGVILGHTLKTKQPSGLGKLIHWLS